MTSQPGPGSGASHIGVFDLKMLLERFRGKQSIVVKLLTLFSEEAEEHRDALLKALAGKNYPALRGPAHTVRGVALNICAADLAAAAAQVEEAVVGQKYESLDEPIARLVAEINRTVAATPSGIDFVNNCRPAVKAA